VILVSITFSFGLRRAWLLAVAIVAVACGPGTIVTTTMTIGSVEGRLVAGSVDWEGQQFECAWLEDATGRRFDVMFPPGWEVTFDPLRIDDTTGRAIASEGDEIRVTYIAEGVGATVCSPDVPLVAETVEVLGSPRLP
jgi:hypothetical protein